jgi:ATP-binding protein involved in chromosome partitioning
MFTNDQVSIPVYGLVENMAYFTPKELPDNKYYIFGKGGAEQLAKELNMPLLASIPISLDISETNDTGNPISLEFDSPEAKAFMELAEKVIAETIKK